MGRRWHWAICDKFPNNLIVPFRRHAPFALYGGTICNIIYLQNQFIPCAIKAIQMVPIYATYPKRQGALRY